MKHKWKNRLLLFASFALPFAAGLLLVTLLGQSALDRMGYLLWLKASPEDFFNMLRIDLISVFYNYVFPSILGLCGVGWFVYIHHKKHI